MHYNELCQLDINIQMNNNNKYKAEVLRLTEMLENSFKEVQYYKKRDNEAQNLKQKIISQIDKLQQQNARLQQERDYYKQSIHEEPSSENKKFKNEYEGAVVVAKAKNYIEKVNEIIKQIGSELKNKGRSAYDYNENEHSILGLEKAFAKAAMGVIKYQQQFLKQSVDKQFMKLQIDKLRKQNTYLYEMTAKLQDNFAEADKITKRLNGEGKKLREQNEDLINQNNQLKAQLESRIKTSSKKITLSTSSSPQNPYEVPSTGIKRSFQSPQSQNKSSPNNNSHQYQLHINELVKKLQNKILLLEQENQNLKNKDKDINNSGSNRQIYSFRQVSDSSEHQVSQNVGSDKKIKDFSRTEEISEQNKKLSKELITAEGKIEKLQNELSRIKMRQQREQEKKYPDISKYSKKIESLQNECKQKSKQIESLRQQIENSQAQKDKIITVYQNESHESKDRIIRHQDALMELQKLAKSFKSKNEQLHKTNKLLSKQLTEKNKEIESYMSLLSGKTEELNKLHCEYQKQKLINEVNNNNFVNVEEKDQKIGHLEAYVKQLILTIDALEQQLKNKTKIAAAQIERIKQQKYIIQADYDHQKERAHLFEQNSTEKDHIIKQLQEKLSEINKELNELAESWGVDDSFKIIELLKEKDRKNAQVIMDVMINKEKMINEKNSIEEHLNGSKDKLKKEKQQIFLLSNGAIQKLSKILNLNILNESEDIEELGEKWNEILEKVEEDMKGTKKQREKMKQMQIIWLKKLSHVEKQLEICREDKQLLEDSISDLKEYAQIRDKQIEQYKQKILDLQNNENQKQKSKQNEEYKQEESGQIYVATSQIYEQEQSYVEQYAGQDKNQLALEKQNQQQEHQREQNKQNDQEEEDSELDRLRNKVKQLEEEKHESKQIRNRQIDQVRTILWNCNQKIHELVLQNERKEEEIDRDAKHRQSMRHRIQQLQSQNNDLTEKVAQLALLLQQQQSGQKQICALHECTQTEGQTYEWQWSQTQISQMHQQIQTDNQYQHQVQPTQQQVQPITQQQVEQLKILKIQAETQTCIEVHDEATSMNIALDDAEIQTQIHITLSSCSQTQAARMHSVQQQCCPEQQQHQLVGTEDPIMPDSQYNERVQEQKEKQQAQTEELNVLKQRIKSMQSQIEQYKKNHQQQLHQYIKFQQQIQLYQQENIALKTTVAQLEETKQQAHNRIAQLQKQNKSRDCIISKIKLQYQSKINDLLLEADSLRNLTQDEKEQKEASITQMQDKIVELQSTLKLYEYANVVYKNSIEQVSDHLSQEIKDLDKNLRQKIAELEKKLQYLETCMREVVRVLKNKNNSCKQQMKISQMKSEVEISYLHVKTQKEMKELSEKSEKQTRQLLKEIKQLQQRIQIFEDRLYTKEKELESKNAEILKLTAQEQTSMETDLIVTQHEKIRKQLELSLSASKQEIQRYQAQLSEHKSKISEQEENVQKLCKQLQKYCEKLNNIEHLYEEVTIQNKVLEQQKQMYTKKEEKYKKQTVMKSNQIQKNEQSIRKLESMNIILQKQVKMYRDELKNLQSVNENLYEMKQKQKQYKMREKKSIENIEQLYKVTLERNQVITKLKTDISQYIKKRDRQLCICKLDSVVVEIKNCIRFCEVGQQYSTNQQVLQAGSQTEIQEKQKQNKEEAIEQINKKQRILIDREHQINKKINILKQLQGQHGDKNMSKQTYQQINRQFNSGFELQKQQIKHSQSIRPFVSKQQKKRDSNKENPQPQSPSLEEKYEKLQIPLQINAVEEETWSKNEGFKETFSTRNTKEQALQKQLKITEQYRQILQAENKNLKKEILRKDKACAKLKQFQKQLSKCKKQIQKMSAEIDMKQKMLRKYDKEFKLKLEDNIKLKRNIENLNEQLELEKKRNKNFEELYDKYKMQKKSIVQSAVTSNDGKN